MNNDAKSDIRSYYLTRQGVGETPEKIFEEMLSLGWKTENIRSEVPEMFETEENMQIFRRQVRPYILISVIISVLTLGLVVWTVILGHPLV